MGPTAEGAQARLKDHCSRQPPLTADSSKRGARDLEMPVGQADGEEGRKIDVREGEARPSWLWGAVHSKFQPSQQASTLTSTLHKASGSAVWALSLCLGHTAVP